MTLPLIRYTQTVGSKLLYARDFGTCTVAAVLGDLTRMSVDVIVNAANSHLVHGGGLAAAIVRAGGPIIQEESLRVAPVAVGSAAATSGGALPCRWIVHAVGPRWGEGEEERKLGSAVTAALDAAAGLGAHSVALPGISTGIFGYPKPAGTRHIVATVVRWIEANPDRFIDEFLLTACDEETALLFAAALERYPDR